jgi:ABC-type transporter Mla subunit MlaD
MAAPVNHWKLGAFVLLVVAAGVFLLVEIGERSAHHASAPFVSYFDESVGGLDSGGRVAFRGVNVGSVSRITIAADHRHVEVDFDIAIEALSSMGIEPIQADRYAIPSDLRAQVGGNGLTGVKYVALDVVDPAVHPPPALPFPPGPNYIPAATSTMKSLEDSLAQAAGRVPDLVDAVVRTSNRLDRMLADLERANVPARIVATVEHADEAIGTLEGTIRRFDRAGVPEKTARVLDDAEGAVAKMDRVLDRLEGEGGLIANMGRTSAEFGQVGRGMASSTRDLSQALDELRDAAEAIRVLAEDLDRDPDMLLKGRGREQAR